MSQLIIYRASAGSGKTHTLVGKYLQLALKSPYAFKNILAITFTNQATQEMKHRIIDLLYDLIQEKKGILTEELISAGWDPKILKNRAQEVLSNILHHYSQFSVSTIDSFFYTVIQNFTQELGLQYGLYITMDLQDVLGTVIKELLEVAQEDSNLKQWLIRFSSHKLIGGKNWNITKELISIGNALFTESFQENELQLIEASNNPEVLRSFVQELQHIITSFETTLQNIGQESLQMMHDYGLRVEDFSYGKQGVMGYLVGLCDKKMIPTKRALSAQHNAGAWCTKKSIKRELILQLVTNKLEILLHDAVDYYQQHYYTYQTALVLNQFAYAFGIIVHLLNHLSNYRDKYNTIFISDVSSFLYKIIAENDTPFIYEKIGNRYQYFFIDEFQDISSLQWKNLKPLIANSIAQGCMNLIVGDVKQAIYRWRGSDWKLLTYQAVNEIQNTQTEYLIYNWRSKKHIITFNNSFFSEAIDRVVACLKGSLESIDNEILLQNLYLQIDQLKMTYYKVNQEIPLQREIEKDLGYVKISFLTDEDEGDEYTEEAAYGMSLGDVSWKKKVKQLLPALIEKLQYDGYELQDIALLVRNHAEAYELLHFLYSYRQSPAAKLHCKYDIMAAASLYLDNQPVIKLLIYSLKYIQDENDYVVKTELCYLYQNFCLGKTPLLHHYTLKTETESLLPSIDDLLPTQLIEQKNFLKQLPLYECIEQLISIFSPYYTNALSLLQSFQDVVLQFIKKENTDLVRFLTWWDEVGATQTLHLGSSVDAMHLMTIHQAKGLQFKIVILPFCSWSFDHPTHNGPIIWGQTSESHFSQFPILPLQYSKRLENTAYEKDYYEEKIQVYLDHLNLLYVAFTRPEDRLYVFTKKTKKEHLYSVTELLYHTFTQYQPFEEQDENNVANRLLWKNFWSMSHDTLEIGREMRRQSKGTIVKKQAFLPFVYKTHSWYPKFSIKKLDITQDFSAFVLPIHYGQLVHQLLASIRYLSDLSNAFSLFQKQVNLTETEWMQLTVEIHKLFKNPIVKSWFCDSWEIKCEVSILMPSGKMMRPDRVMIGSNEVIVVDYKIGVEQNKHIHQVQEYASLLQAMGYCNVKAYLLYIEGNKLVLC